MEAIKGELIEYQGNNDDAGICVLIECPKCKNHVHLAEYAWWPQSCECGYKWKFDINITGYRAIPKEGETK